MRMHRQILVRAPEPVFHPCPHRRAARKLAARRDVKRGGTVILVIHLDAVNKREVIHMPGEVRKQLGNIPARLAILLKLERAPHALMVKRQTPLQFA